MKGSYEMKNRILNVKSLVFLFVIVLLICGTQGISYGAVTGEITECSGRRHSWPADSLVDVTIRGTIRATRNVTNVVLRGTANGHFVGVALIGGLSAGQSKNFAIRGTITTTADRLSCGVSAEWLEINLPEPDPDPPPPEAPSDLVVERPTVSKSRLDPGERFTLSTSVTNEGAGSAAATTLRYYRSTDSTISSSDTEVGTDSVGALGANRGSDESITLTAPTSPGIYYYGACVDAVSGESRSNNNCSASVSITVQPPPSDLVVEQPAVSKSTLAPGERFTLSTSVTNEGAGRAAATTLRYYRSTDATITTSDTEVGTDSVSGLGSNRSGTESITLTAPTSPGTYYYGACVDAVSDESDSNNNCSDSVSITVQPPPSDLVVEQPAVSKSTLAPGENFTLSTTVRNSGAGSAAATMLRYYRSPDATISTSDTEVGTDPVSSLSANRSSDESIPLTAPIPPGTYYYGACVESVSDESNSNNNCSAAVSITVNPPTLGSSTPSLLTEATLDGSKVTLTLRFGTYDQSLPTISNAVMVSGIVGVTVGTVRRVNDTEVTVTLAFDGTDFDTNAVLTFGVGADAITNYSGVTLIAEITVTARQESISTRVAAPLTEGTLDRSPASLTLTGATYEQSLPTISNAITVSGIAGVKVGQVRRVSDTKIFVTLAFDGTNFDTDATLTFSVGADAIANYYGSALTAQVPVTAIKGFDFDFSLPAGMSMIHVPLNVTKVDGAEKTIESISALYDALGGAGAVNFLITYDPATGGWLSYFGASDKGTATDRTLTDDMGIMANLVTPTTVRLTGDALGTGGSSTITLTPGLNLVGLPLNDSRITRVSDLLAFDGIRGNVFGISLADGGEFKTVGHAGDPGDIPITGGQAFILTAQSASTVTLSGEPWTNTSGAAAPSSVVFRGIAVRDTTPVLALRGVVVDERTGANEAGFRVTVKNLSTGRTIAGMTKAEGGAYKLTVVDIETGRAAAIGDVLEISAQSPNPFIGVESLRYTLTAEDVKQSLIQLPELVAYEIPAETQLLPNYPNPFNPETWIPYHLANSSDVLLSIYDINGALVRELDLGHQRAGYYTDRSRAAYWDGRNEWGEQVASGIYFYQLRAGDYLKLRKMVIIK